MLRPSFQRRMPPTALACLGGALIPTMYIIPLTRCTSRSPATPVPYSFQQRHRAKMNGSNGRLGTVPCHVSQSRFLGEDRKSTRLNSSHSQISYAVFCLKKKKQQLWTYSELTILCTVFRYALPTSPSPISTAAIAFL